MTAVPELLAEGFRFRGSLGTTLSGHAAFIGYVDEVRTALAEYRCDVLECVAENDRAFAQMLFAGVHAAPFRGWPPTGKPVQWMGAALFRFNDGKIAELWVLGDMAGLEAVLRANAAE